MSNRSEVIARAVRRPAALVAATILLAGLAGVPAGHAQTGGVCANDVAYLACARVFPDPLAGTLRDPNAEGLTAAGTFIQFGTPGEIGGSEVWDGLKFLERRYGRYLEVTTLEEMLDDPDARSAGLWLGGQRKRLPLIIVRVTDEQSPAAAKKKFVFGLSLHGIERAGVEGGARAIEDLATYAHCESLGSLAAAQADSICSKQTHVRIGAYQSGRGGFPARLLPWDESSLTMAQALEQSELYFTFNNPDGWHRGDLPSFGGVGHYQRYNGNGVDPNRDWPTVGWTFRGYTPGSEPETKNFARALKSLGGNWGGGIDLHGMHFAPAFTYTMLPAGQHDYRKNARIRAIAEQTQEDALARLTWSPMIRRPDQPSVPYGVGRAPMLPQQWGTVWDTINYTITGGFGDWIDNDDIGLGGIGMNNEMALSHVSNCYIGSCFVAEVEQLHVAGNKGLIYSQIDTTLRTERTAYRFPFNGKGAYVRYDNVLSHPGSSRGYAAVALPAQEDITGAVACQAACYSEEFEVKGAGDGVFNGGMTVNIGFAGTHTPNDESGSDWVVQRYDTSHGEESGEWVDVASHYSEGQLYLVNAATITVNTPLPGRYRIYMDPSLPGPYTYEVLFDRAEAHDDPGQRPYRVTNLDFFDDLNRYLPEENRFRALSAPSIIADGSVLDGYDVVVLADDALPGWDERRPSRSTLTRAQHDAYYAALRDYVRGGGKLVLLDAAMQALRPLIGRASLTTSRQEAYAGFIGFNDGGGTTYDDPLAKGVNVPGAAEGSGNRHQTYEPVPLGYQIAAETVRFPNSSPVWIVDQAAFEEAGGRVAGRTLGGVSLGEIALGKGSIRMAGALLPNPTVKFDHPFGLKSYALTYTGWQLFENLVHVKAASSGSSGAPGETRVLSNRPLPRTGVGDTALVFAVALLLALPLARRLRDVYWV